MSSEVHTESDAYERRIKRIGLKLKIDFTRGIIQLELIARHSVIDYPVHSWTKSCMISHSGQNRHVDMYRAEVEAGFRGQNRNTMD